MSCSKKDEQLKKIGQDLKDTEKKLEQEKKDLENISKQKEEELNKAKDEYDKAVEENNKTGKYPGKYPFTSMRELTNEDFKGMSDFDLNIMENEILARYGYIFKDKEMKSYFSEQKWYSPKNSNVDKLLSVTEKKNLETIKAYTTKKQKTTN
jgi:vacuolar-type H+-ATPase subunit I/STV1